MASAMASIAAQAAANAAKFTCRELAGVVVSAGLMDKTVKVRVGGQKWHRFLRKHFNAPKTHLVHDPHNSLRKGDVVAITPGWRASQHIRHVVNRIIAPADVPVSERPAIPTAVERWHARISKKAAKDSRRALRMRTRQAEHAVEEAKRRVGSLASKVARSAQLLGLSYKEAVAMVKDEAEERRREDRVEREKTRLEVKERKREKLEKRRVAKKAAKKSSLRERMIKGGVVGGTAD